MILNKRNKNVVLGYGQVLTLQLGAAVWGEPGLRARPCQSPLHTNKLINTTIRQGHCITSETQTKPEHLKISSKRGWKVRSLCTHTTWKSPLLAALGKCCTSPQVNVVSFCMLQHRITQILSTPEQSPACSELPQTTTRSTRFLTGILQPCMSPLCASSLERTEPRLFNCSALLAVCGWRGLVPWALLRGASCITQGICKQN